MWRKHRTECRGMAIFRGVLATYEHSAVTYMLNVFGFKIRLVFRLYENGRTAALQNCRFSLLRLLKFGAIGWRRCPGSPGASASICDASTVEAAAGVPLRYVLQNGFRFPSSGYERKPAERSIFLCNKNASCSPRFRAFRHCVRIEEEAAAGKTIFPRLK